MHLLIFPGSSIQELDQGHTDGGRNREFIEKGTVWKQAREMETLRDSKALSDGSSTQQPDFSRMPSPLLVTVVGRVSSLSANWLLSCYV